MGQPVALIARIAIASPLRTLFDYTLGACCAAPPNLRPGMRVKVPFGRRQVNRSNRSAPQWERGT